MSHDKNFILADSGHSGDLIEVILGNPAMINAYQSGLPAVGRQFPDGVKMAKIHWKAKKSADEPGAPTVPGALDDIDFMEKDGKRFADTSGWGYAQFNYDTASDSFTLLGNDAKCGYACHTIVAAKDYVFTAYGKRRNSLGTLMDAPALVGISAWAYGA
jgi:hypothetical protein